jgi:hypothetical protein
MIGAPSPEAPALAYELGMKARTGGGCVRTAETLSIGASAGRLRPMVARILVLLVLLGLVYLNLVRLRRARDVFGEGDPKEGQDPG